MQVGRQHEENDFEQSIQSPAWMVAEYEADEDYSRRYTDTSGDQWLTVSKRSTGGGGGGMVELLGGTGKYAGITGSCSYTVKYLPDDWASVEMNREWSRS